MLIKIRKWGNNLALRIPKAFAVDAQLENNSIVEVSLSPLAYNQKVGLAILCLVTSHVKGYPFEVLIPDGLPINGAILADQVKSLDWRARDAELICRLPSGTVAEVLGKLLTLLEH
jgi:mRNA interferase MazF